MSGFKTLRKVHLTLLETLIAVTLLSVLLVIVFGFFRELAVITTMTQKTEKESFQIRYVETRLGYIFERIVNENDKKTRKFYFYTEPPKNGVSPFTSLIFTFDNGVRIDPTFSGDILARLYVDTEKQLCLAMWPIRVEDPHEYMQNEILLDNVVGLEFQFYSAPERVASEKSLAAPNKIDPEKKEPEKDRWYSDEWLLSYDQMPSLLKIILTIKREPGLLERTKKEGSKEEDMTFEYVYALPSSKNFVYYPPD